MAWSEKARAEAARAVDMLDHRKASSMDELTRMVADAALDAAAVVDGDPVDIRTVTAYESGFEAGKNEAGDAIEALEKIDKFEINANDSMVNQVFRLKNIARNALGRIK
jgi:hypothetical protein